ncbi:MAG: FkbM family methyltransferase [Anaerolineae bacterium]
MKKLVQSTLPSLLAPFLENQVYVQRTGLMAGLKRRGGFGFLPLKKALTREHTFLKSLDFKGETVYDVGGHIGLISMFFARAVGETGNVITFEPNPSNYDAILDHIELNGFTNIRVIKMGLGSKRETLKFVVPSSALGTADPSKHERYLKREGVQVFQIELDTMDRQIAVNNLPKPDFVKMDVEGLEIDVLHGMTQTISDHRPRMLIELHGTNERGVVEFLLAHNYELRQVEDDIDITQQNIGLVHGHLYAYFD